MDNKGYIYIYIYGCRLVNVASSDLLQGSKYWVTWDYHLFAKHSSMPWVPKVCSMTP